MGSICLTPGASAAAPTFGVVFDEVCLTDCIDTRQSCNVIVDDDRIELYTRLESRRPSRPDGDGTIRVCNDECVVRLATCELPPLADGNYVVSFAGRVADVVLPLTQELHLFGDIGCPAL